MTSTASVSRGCRGANTYCVMRQTYGGLRSKPLDAVLSEFDKGLAQGHREFRLMAQDLGAYGQDIGTEFIQLLRALFDRPGQFQLQLIDVNIRWVVGYLDELVELLSENVTRTRILQMPVQSGSDRILELMRRGHTAAEAEGAFRAIREAMPDLLLVTHALVGFPSETEEDFEKTVRLLRTGRFDRVDIFDYSDRPGTAASRMPDKVPAGIIRARSRRLHREYGGPAAGLACSVRSRFLRD